MTIQIAQRIGRALGVRSGTRIKELDEGLREYVRTVPKANNTPMPGSISASQVTSGTFADARIPQSAVTQHQAALALAASQITSGILGVARGGTSHGSYTAGDLLYANTISTLARLGVGSAGDLLRVSGGAPAWQAVSTLSIPWGQLTSVPSTFTPANHLVGGTWTPADSSGASLALTVAGSTTVHEKLMIARAEVTYPVTADTSQAILTLPATAASGQHRCQAFVTFSDCAVSMYWLPVAGTGLLYGYVNPGATALQNAQLSGKTVYLTLIYDLP